MYIDFRFSNTCRSGEYPVNCDCNFSPSVSYESLPTFDPYISSSMGRPIDIDVDICSREIRPESEDFGDKTNYILYYRPQHSGWPLLIVDNIPYDTREPQNIKIFTAPSPEILRGMVCTRIRFASIRNSGLLETDIDNALISNWPYNDLYWYNCEDPDLGGDSIPNPETDVAVDLIPC